MSAGQKGGDQKIFSLIIADGEDGMSSAHLEVDGWAPIAFVFDEIDTDTYTDAVLFKLGGYHTTLISKELVEIVDSRSEEPRPAEIPTMKGTWDAIEDTFEGIGQEKTILSSGEVAFDPEIDRLFQAAIKDEEKKYNEQHKITWIPKHIEHMQEELAEKRRAFLERFAKEWFRRNFGICITTEKTSNLGFYAHWGEPCNDNGDKA